MPAPDEPGGISARPQSGGTQWGGAEVAEQIVPGAVAPIGEPPTGLAPPDAIPAALATGPEGGEVITTGSLIRQIVRVFAENKLAVIGLGVIVFMLLFCFIGPLLYKTNQVNGQQALLQSTQNASPTGSNLLGTDQQGFDMLGRLMFGGKNSLIVGFAAAAVSVLWGVVYGAVSGFFGGWVDALMMRLVDILLSIPVLFLTIALAVIFRPSLGLLILVIGFVSWLITARLVRGETLTLRVREFVQAVRVMGGRNMRIVLRHIVPNTVGTIVVNATFQVADAILLLAALGFVGLGVPLPQTDWGSMLSNGVTYAINGYWWEIYPAGVCIVLVVVSFNFIGDALRDALEVRLQRR
jgi:peptide/nickel transport system permease protein